MIKRIEDNGELHSFLKVISVGEINVEAQKLLALEICYGTKYDFCGFYSAGNAVLCLLNKSCIIYGGEDIHFRELAEFLDFSGCSDVFCSPQIGAAICERAGFKATNVNLMRFASSGVPACVEKDTPLEEIFEIISSGFDIEFEPWYLDISHRIRHGVSQTRRLGDSALVIQHDLNGCALISQIATLPSSRGSGGAARLILAVCAELAPSKVYLICTDALRKFYEKIGFVKIGDKAVLTKKG